MTGSRAFATSGPIQVGYAFDYGAVLWHGSAESVVFLGPPGYSSTFATAVSENSQVGHGRPVGKPDHAILWHGTAASAVDLHPTDFFDSFAYGASETTQVGSGRATVASEQHALLWHSTASSVVDLHPIGFTTSEARAASAAGQVGFASGPSTNSLAHAFVWNGSAPSAIDLHSALLDVNPIFAYSYANGISDNGTIVGAAYDAYNFYYAVMWTPVPEPTAFALILCGALVASFRRRRRVIA
jgi:uncharacterized membrane protein